MITTQLNITFEGPQVSAEGVAVDDLQPVLERIQCAVRLMVEHLAGTDGTPDLTRKHSELRPVRISPGADYRAAASNFVPDVGGIVVWSGQKWLGR
jgi:hypothetical protein